MHPQLFNVQQVVQAVVGALDFRLGSPAVVSDNPDPDTIQQIVSDVGGTK